MTHSSPAYNRRELMARLGVGAALLPFVTNLPGVSRAVDGGGAVQRKRRLVVWPETIPAAVGPWRTAIWCTTF